MYDFVNGFFVSVRSFCTFAFFIRTRFDASRFPPNILRRVFVQKCVPDEFSVPGPVAV